MKQKECTFCGNNATKTVLIDKHECSVCEEHLSGIELFDNCLNNSIELSTITNYLMSINLFYKETLEDLEEVLNSEQSEDYDENILSWFKETYNDMNLLKLNYFKAWLGKKELN